MENSFEDGMDRVDVGLKRLEEERRQLGRLRLLDGPLRGQG